ncbi:MAG TPA: peptidylprolyl isomerase [Saprospiraceae bacterium]|nr:peptidylprolyl isomerase [Saprospiraceae bacterium]
MNIFRSRGAHFSLVLFFAFVLSDCGRNKNAHALIHTNMGDIRVRLFDSTHRHRDNFIFFTEQHAGDTLLFYRVERDFAIQFGPPPEEPKGHETVLQPEIGAPLLSGALAAVKAGGLSDAMDFFIVLGRSQTDASLDEIERKTAVRFSKKERDLYKRNGGLPQLHGQYTVFGEVVSGLETAQKIAALPRDAEGRPLQQVLAQVAITK